VPRAWLTAGRPYALPHKSSYGSSRKLQSSHIRRGVFSGLQLLATALFLTMVVKLVDTSAVLDRFRSADPLLLVTAHAICSLQLLAIGARWSVINHVIRLRPEISVRDQFRAVVLMYAASQVLPSSIGGDVVRLLALNRRGVSVGRAAWSVLLDRLAGLFGLAVVAGAAFGLSALQGAWANYAPYGALGASASMLLASSFYLVIKARRGTEALQEAARSRKAHALFLPVWAVAPHLLNLITAYFVGRALGVELPFSTLVVALSPAIFASALPISFAGWGIREVMVVAAFQLAGLDSAAAVALSVCWGGVMLSVALTGVLFCRPLLVFRPA
jgi:glycosyltransferase 2 family protein